MKHTIAACVAISLFSSLAYAQEDPWTPSSLCPYPSEDLTRAPYEGDCTKYWECFEGARYIMTCPNGLEYNEATARCDQPELANCNKDASITYPTYPHTQDPSATTSTPFTPDPLCPFPSEILVFFPYPFNCSQYWECFEGKRYLMSCPTNLYWNVDAEYCDYIENVDCNKNVASTTSTTSVTTSVTTTPVPATPTNQTTATEQTTTPTTPIGPTGVWTPDPLCPYPSEDLIFFAHERNCTQYWECFEGNKYLMSCPIGLYWNDEANVCDYSANVDCDRTHTTTTVATTTPPPTNATESTISTPSGPSTTTTPAPTTPAVTCLNTADGTFFRDPFDCSRYYECLAGKGIPMQCPGALYWNEVKLTCDYPENVNCNV